MAEEIFDPLRRTVEGVATGVGDVVGGIGKGISSAVGGVGDAVGGLLGGFQNMPADDRMALINTLGRSGAALMALGQPGYNPKLRQQAIMALGNVPGQVQRERLESQKGNLLRLRLAQEADRMAKMKSLSDLLSTDSGASAIAKSLGMTVDEVRTLPAEAVADIRSKIAIARATRDPLQALQRQLNVQKSLLELTGTGDYGLGGGAPPAAANLANPAGLPAGTTPPPSIGAPPAAAPLDATKNIIEQRFPNATLLPNKNVNFNTLFGPRGTWENIYSKGRALTVGPSPETRDYFDARAAYDSIRNNMFAAAGDSATGKQLKMTQERLRELFPEAGKITVGPAEVASRFKAAVADVDRALNVEIRTATARNATPAARAQAAKNVNKLRPLSDSIKAMLFSMEHEGKVRQIGERKFKVIKGMLREVE